MFFRQIFDPALAQYAYLIGCQQTGEALVIDPERDIDRYVTIAAEEDLRIVAVTETHIHADFLSGAGEFSEQHGVKLFLSDEGDSEWKYNWAKTGDYDVHLLKDNDVFAVGHILIQALHTPGHTPEHMSFLITDLGGGATEPIGIASGDFVFVGDLGRPDLLETAAGVVGAREPSAHRLFESTKRFLALEDHVQVWPGHGAGSACGKALGAVPQSTVGYERRFNIGFSFDAADGFVDAILDGQPEPPLYFARMKDLNKNGVPVLGDVPAPKLYGIERLTERGSAEGAVIVDTRADREAHMAGHIPGSLHAPLGIDFAMVVGSYVEPSTDIYLLVDSADVDEAARTLVRIGYDRIAGYASPGTLIESGVAREVTPRIAFSDLSTDIDPDAYAIWTSVVWRSTSKAISHAPSISRTRDLRSVSTKYPRTNRYSPTVAPVTARRPPRRC